MTHPTPDHSNTPYPPQQYIADDEIDLRELFAALLKGKWIIILTTIVFSAGAVIYALRLPNIYKSDILLAPAESSGQGGLSKMASQFGGLASLAGINFGSNSTSQTDLATQVLQSRQFIDNFIQKHDLLVPLMASKGWDLTNNKLIYDDDLYNSENHKWLREPKGLRGSAPTAQEAYELFTKKVLSVTESKDSGLFTISVSFYSPYLAQQWATWLVEDINQVMRERTIDESTQNLDYLKDQLSKTAIADMKSTFYQLIEEQTKSLMLAEVQEEFVFKVVDPAVISELKYKPNRKLLIIIGIIIGIIVGTTISIINFVCKK